MVVDDSEVVLNKLLQAGVMFALVAGFFSAVAIQPSPEPDRAVVQRGIEVYGALYCSACHQLSVADAKGVFGPPHDAMGIIAGARIHDPGYRGSATTAEEYIRESIVAPEAYRVPGYQVTYHRMPAYTSLDAADLEALVQMLLQQTGQR